MEQQHKNINTESIDLELIAILKADLLNYNRKRQEREKEPLQAA